MPQSIQSVKKVPYSEQEAVAALKGITPGDPIKGRNTIPGGFFQALPKKKQNLKININNASLDENSMDEKNITPPVPKDLKPLGNRNNRNYNLSVEIPRENKN